MALHCPRCQNPIHLEWAVCPACGLLRPGKRGQVRCRKCGVRTDRTFHVCPTCGADLKPAPFPLWPLGGYIRIALSALVVTAIVWGVMRIKPDVEQGAQQAAAFFMPTPTPTMTVTRTPTATPTPTGTPTTTPTRTVTPSPVPTDTPTATPSLPASPTPKPLSPTATPTVKSTPTPALRFAAPVLVGPPDGEIFVGPDQFVILRWEAVGLLAEDEWYAVRLSWSENGVFAQRGGDNVKETFWQIPAGFYWGKADQATGRAYEWYVYVERVTETDDGQRLGEPASPPSETRVLSWQ